MGEAPTRALCARALRELRLDAFHSVYGSTEASSSLVLDLKAQLAFDGDDDGPLPLGGPLCASVVATVAEADGALRIAGPNLFAGYVGDDAPRLIESDGGLVYDTSDLAALEPARPGDPAAAFDVDGSPRRLVHRGRADGVVKIRGFRVELGDVEQYVRKAAAALDVALDDVVAVVAGGALGAVAAPADVDGRALRAASRPSRRPTSCRAPF
ncbi:hypothetical protein JL722_14396 [Aureococcus anophagefferens]|nr:hypothetical protein JL722_14396 [Aureococcus anophagefferens]